MKALFTVLMIIFFLVPAISQEVQKEEKEEKSDRSRVNDPVLVIDIAHARWLDAPDNVDIEYQSRNFNVYIMRKIPLGTSPFSIGLGLGLSSHNIFNDIQFTEDSTGQTVFVPFQQQAKVSKNKLVTNYVELPFELWISSKRNKNDKRLNLIAGAKVGYLINDHTKTIRENSKIKDFNIPNISPFRYGIYGRIGYGWLYLTSFYSLSALFDDNRGPQVIPFTAGVSIIFND